MEISKEDVLDWALGASWEEKYDFVKTFLTTLSDQGLRAVKNEAGRARNRIKATRAANVVEPVPSEPVQAALADQEEPPKWFSGYSPENIVGYDCEFVNLHDGNLEVCAKVAIVNSGGQEVYSATVYHAPGSFRLDAYHINGIGENDLMHGREFEVVRKEVQEILRGKLVVICGGFDGVKAKYKDFTCLKLEPGEFDIFNIHSHFYKGSFSSNGKEVREPIGLRSLVHYFFNIDIQQGFHDAGKDAKYTLKLFTDIYYADVVDPGTRYSPFHELYSHIPKKQ